MEPRLAGPSSRHRLDVHTARQTHLAVIVVCRQTYQEARTLPFSLSTWVFLSRKYLTIANLSRFRDFQIREIRNVYIEYALRDCVEKDSHLKVLQDRGVFLCDMLPGIRELSLVYHDYTPPPMRSDGSLVWWEESDKVEMRKAFKNLKTWLLQGSDGKIRLMSNLEDPPC
jgi:hypothetical protein